ncbi:MAG: 3-deoxy-manno-octulosonate cytidylyltransferase [Bacteroidetes bacterium]|nr:MAG: 3-deoxy-manno-octulosonate cytidylyltransferase [Bacteroidota bacterium]
MKQFIGIIPARYASSRFPGKPLAILLDKPMIQWVYEAAAKVLDQVVVATDDERIFKAVEGFGGKAVMTGTDHSSGTERCAEACRILRKQHTASFSHVINIQGDEPLLQGAQLNDLMSCFEDEDCKIATLLHPLKDEGIHNPNRVKVVTDHQMRALYFSRSPIPFLRDIPPEEWARHQLHDQHLGLYAFRAGVLEELVRLPPCKLEQAESLEQLRWLYNGYRIQTKTCQSLSRGVDTPEDLEAVAETIRRG